MTIADTPAASKAVLPDRLGRLRVGEGFLEPGGLASAEPAAWETALCEMETRFQLRVKPSCLTDLAGCALARVSWSQADWPRPSRRRGKPRSARWKHASSCE